MTAAVETRPDLRALLARAQDAIVAEWRALAYRPGAAAMVIAVVTTHVNVADELDLEEVDGDAGLFAGLVARPSLQPVLDRGLAGYTAVRDRVQVARMLTHIDDPIAAVGCVRIVVLAGGTVHVNTVRVVTHLEMI